MSEHYQVVVVGAGMAGVGAAVAAGRGGAKTLLVEAGSSAGGLGSGGLVPCFVPFSYKPDPIVNGIAGEMYRRLQNIHGSNKASWPFLDAESVKLICDEMLIEAGVELAYLTNMIKVETENRRIKCIHAVDREGERIIEADNFIDTTGDAALAFAAGVPVRKGDSQGRTQPGSCCIVVAGVDAARIPEADKQKDDTTFYLTDALRRYNLQWLEVGELTNRENFEFHVAGANLDPERGIVRINLGHFYDLGCCDHRKISKLLVDGRKYGREYTECLRRNLPGFENCTLVATPTLPDIRESRSIIGRTILQPDDFWEGRRHDDDIAIFDYMLDVHALVKEENENETKLVVTPSYEKLLNTAIEKFYGIPYSILLPEAFDNLGVAGRCVSAEQSMLGSLRVMPACLAMGQALGTAAAMSKDLANVDIKKLQNKLLEDQVILDYPN